MGDPSTSNLPLARKIAIFLRCFHGRLDAYGTYDPRGGRVWQVKAPVTDQVIVDHLTGRRPYGVYLLAGDRTAAVVADFDQPDAQPPLRLIEEAAQLGLAAYMARSRRKGFHVYLFAQGPGVSAAKARRVMHWLLAKIGAPSTEVFPKQDHLAAGQWGNFINTPLFGPLVACGRGVFLDPQHALAPYSDQWDLLDNVVRMSAFDLDAALSMIAQTRPDPGSLSSSAETPAMPQVAASKTGVGLPPCARRMLQGVSDGQRVSCFRLAVQCKRLGVPLDLALAMLHAWATKNCPDHGQRIRPAEVEAQTRAAYSGRYRSCGCEDPLIARYCHPTCPIKRFHETNAGE